ncbi:MAG: hypothetical protein E7040_01150 [Lentisphaerae bacterium]|nr:hypothetical protein [Lentisphaerota bacterium]
MKKRNLFAIGFLFGIICLSAADAAPQPLTFNDEDSIRWAEGKVGTFRYKPGMDVREWQAEARKDLIKKLGIEAKLKALRVPLSPRILWQRKVKNGTITKLILQSEKDYSFPAYLCIPDGNGPFPVWICVQGHGTGMHASISVRWQDEKTFKYDGGDRNFVEQCLERGYAALCIEQRAMGERSGYSDHRPGCLRQARHALMFGETLIGNRVFDVDRGIDFIYSRKDLRHDRIGIVGNSGGGTTSIYSGAILDRLTHVMPSSCFSTYRDSILKIEHCGCNYFPGMLNWGDMGDLAGLCAPKTLVIVSGVSDMIFPIEPAKAEFKHAKMIYRAMGIPNRCHHVIGNKGHRFYKDEAWKVMEPLYK